MSTDLQSQWRENLKSVGGRLLCARLTHEQMQDIACDLAHHDLNSENSAISMALGQVCNERKVGTDDLSAVYFHQLNVLRRESRWLLRETSFVEFRKQLQVKGQEWLKEADGAPTVVISPMQVYPSDGVAVCASLFSGRRLAFYGEGLASEQYAHIESPIEFVKQGFAGVRAADEVLTNNGVFCTHPDFVHTSHGAVSGSLFGTDRPYASAFAQLCARPRCVLLPLNIDCRLDRVEVEFLEPTQMPDVPAKELRTDETLSKVVRFVGSTLESIIRRRPESWVLLNTLVMDCMGMAQVA